MSRGTDFLTEVNLKLRKRIQEIDGVISEGQKDIEDMNEYYWENYTEMDQYGYENFDNQQALFQQMNANQEQLLLKQRFYRMMDSPFFGRVDFCFEGEKEAETFYIGIGNFTERTGTIPLVYDWRAPVSGLFYDYDKGPASYTAPGGEMSGEIVSKWQYKIRGGKMVYEFESDIKIDDEILKAELGNNSEVQLKNIIRTIQKEQNAIIRNTQDKILVIQGAAGSGKTSIALHRIAYLLYHDRNHLKSSNILVLSPNGVFADYISHILPELGEEHIQEMSFDLYAYRQLKDTVSDCEDKYHQIEKILHCPEIQKSYKEKQSAGFIDQMEYFMMELEDELMRFKDISYRGFEMKESRIIELFYYKFMDIPLLSRMNAVAEYFIDEVETLLNKDLPDEERESIMEKFMGMYETRDFYVLYNAFLKREGYPVLPKVSYEKRVLPYEDVYPVLYLKYRLKQHRPDRNIKHLVVDEMQDYSRLQYMILQEMFSCSMTILGDRAQTMEEEPQDVMKFLPKIFKNKVQMIVMNKSYRNTVEIAQYANSLAGITDMEIFERHGAPVEEQECSSFEAALVQAVEKFRFGEEQYETAALLFRSEAEAKAAYGWLKTELEKQGFDVKKRLSYLHRDSSSFRKGLIVTTFYLAKGLEFDQVFSVFPAEDHSPLAEQARYICVTRALHELHMYEYV